MLFLIAAGSVFFPGLFLLSKQCLRYIPGLQWNEGDTVNLEFNDKLLVSSIQAIMASTAGYIISSSCHDIIEDQHWLTSTYILFAVPYFVYDIYAMFLCYWYKMQVKGHEVDNGSKSKVTAVMGYLRREFLMVLHHVVMVTVCFPVSVFWRQGKGDYFQGVMFLAELSTPSVCLGKVLIQDLNTEADLTLGSHIDTNTDPYKQQHTLLHKVNGCLMLITFFLCRVLLFPYLYYVYGRYASIPFYRVPLAVPWQCNLGTSLLMAPQLYWFSLICRGALRLFTGRPSLSRKPTVPIKAYYDGQDTLTQSANGYSTRMVAQDTSTVSH
ncbi:hypothetical protein DNTS_004356 [Danionella cerebrum]|uniref:TLC domain-containing protein n=1 Tax=Danionella cerebrum TaxID=2873325 RepID=A0A553P934_9TELE|nr:hypothetical protein DNTS_004356 [Danionella translucida]